MKNGGDRQELHEKIRVHSQAAGKVVKEEGGENDLMKRIAADKSFKLTEEELSELLRPELYIGRCEQQVTEFLDGYVRPVLEQNRSLLGVTAKLSV